MREEKVIKEVAADRIERLFGAAEQRTEKEGETGSLAKRYISLARRISTHYKVKVPSGIKNRICKKCNSVLIPGISCTVRKASSGYMVYRCSCGTQKRIFFNNKQ